MNKKLRDSILKRKAQSILDILNVFPLENIVLRKPQITNREARALFNIWKQDQKDEYGKFRTEGVDNTAISSLNSKGLVRGQTNAVEITSKGKEIIKKIVLEEQSSFESNGEIDIEKAMSIKIASKQQQKEPKDLNWLQKIWKSPS